MRKKCVVLLVLTFAIFNLQGETIVNNINEWRLDSVVVKGSESATLYLSKTFELDKSIEEIKVYLPFSEDESIEVWAVPTLFTMVTEIYEEPQVQNNSGTNRAIIWQDSLKRMENELIRLQARKQAIELALRSFEKTNVIGRTENPSQWIERKITTAEQFFKEKTELESQIKQLILTIESVKKFLKDAGLSGEDKQTVLVIRPNVEKPQQYKFIMRITTYEYDVEPVMEMHISDKEKSQMTINWIIKMNQTTGFDWTNTTVVYHPSYVVFNQEVNIKKKFRDYPKVLVTEAYITKRTKKTKEKEVTEEEPLILSPASTLMDRMYGSPVKKIIPLKMTNIVRIEGVTLEDGVTKSLLVMTKTTDSLDLDWYAFSGSRFAYLMAVLPVKVLYPLISTKMVLYYNGMLVGEREAPIYESLSDTVIIPIVPNYYVSAKTGSYDPIEKVGLFKTRKEIDYIATLRNNSNKPVEVKYITLVVVRSSLIDFNVESPTKPVINYDGYYHVLIWEVQIPARGTVELPYTMVFTTKRKYEIKVSSNIGLLP